MLSANNLTKSFGSLVVAQDVALELPKGARYALIGPNGAGKTTLINLLTGMLAPEQREETIGTAEIRTVFVASKIGTVAGSMVTAGIVRRGARFRLLRENVVIYTGEVESVRRMKDDVREVAAGFECGIKLKNYNDIKEGDLLEFFEVKEVARTL